jgi:hypothetical protein
MIVEPKRLCDVPQAGVEIVEADENRDENN